MTKAKSVKKKAVVAKKKTAPKKTAKAKVVAPKKKAAPKKTTKVKAVVVKKKAAPKKIAKAKAVAPKKKAAPKKTAKAKAVAPKKKAASKKTAKAKAVAPKKKAAPKKTAKAKAVAPKKKAAPKKAIKAKAVAPKKKAEPRKPTGIRKSNFKRKITKLLVNVKNQILNEVSEKVRAESDDSKLEIGDIYDLASSERERELSLILGDRDRAKLGEIDDALERLSYDCYEECEECGEPIAQKRLLAMPFTRVCVECKSKHERQQKATGRFEEDLPAGLIEGSGVDEDIL